jgi:hypothetical protein
MIDNQGAIDQPIAFQVASLQKFDLCFLLPSVGGQQTFPLKHFSYCLSPFTSTLFSIREDLNQAHPIWLAVSVANFRSISPSSA